MKDAIFFLSCEVKVGAVVFVDGEGWGCCLGVVGLGISEGIDCFSEVFLEGFFACFLVSSVRGE